jgi:hypothetical protein
VAKQLNAMLRHWVSENLDELLHAADGTLLANFAAGLRHDFDAVKASLRLPWTTSPVEGQNSRLSAIADGRPSLDSITSLRLVEAAAPRFPSTDEISGAGYAAGRVGRLTRRCFTGCTGNGVQVAMDRAHRRAFSLSVMPGNSRRNSTAAESSPPCS